MAGIEADVMALELELLRPATRADAQRLDALLADDFHEVGAGGRAFGKDDVLARLPQEQGVGFDVQGMAAHVLAPEVVLVTYRATRSDEEGSAASMRSSLWVRGASGWQMRYHQGTRL